MVRCKGVGTVCYRHLRAQVRVSGRPLPRIVEGEIKCPVFDRPRNSRGGLPLCRGGCPGTTLNSAHPHFIEEREDHCDRGFKFDLNLQEVLAMKDW